MKVGVLVNPAARRNRTKKPPLREIADKQADTLYEELDQFSKLPEALERFIHANAPAILVSGGDGTVQAVQTWLAENVPHDNLPKLAILPGGTTNMDAADIGVQNPNSHSVLERLMSPEYCRRSTEVRQRNTIRIDNPAGRPPQHGMFFGIGAIQRAVVMCQRDIHALGFTGELAGGVTLLRALFRTLVLGNRDTEPDRIYQPAPMVVTADSQTFATGDQLFALVTTLHRLVLGARPFWNQSDEALKTTVASYPVNGLLGAVLPVLYARNDRPPRNPAFSSIGARHLTLETDAPFILDGEFFDAPAGEPLSISLGPKFDYLCG